MQKKKKENETKLGKTLNGTQSPCEKQLSCERATVWESGFYLFFNPKFAINFY